jgi:hypothetical protein
MPPRWNRFEDLVSNFVPDEESRVAVVMMDEIVDGRVRFLVEREHRGEAGFL